MKTSRCLRKFRLNTFTCNKHIGSISAKTYKWFLCSTKNYGGCNKNSRTLKETEVHIQITGYTSLIIIWSGKQLKDKELQRSLTESDKGEMVTHPKGKKGLVSTYVTD